MTGTASTLATRPVHIAVLITCHNRRDTTLACLERLFAQDCVASPAHEAPRARIEVFLVDDGSTDGTAQAVRTRFPQVNVIEGPGDLYWAGGMRLAWRHALRGATHDAYLLLNDDTLLLPHALSALLDTSDFMRREHGAPGIAVGSITDEQDRHHYGGSLWWKARGDVEPGTAPRPCDLFNCNATLVSAEAYRVAGGFSDAFTHAMADYELASRASRLQVPCYVAPGYLGTCRRNPVPRWLDPATPLRERWQLLRSPKGLPLREYAALCRALYGWRWPIALVATYARVLFFPRRRTAGNPRP